MTISICWDRHGRMWTFYRRRIVTVICYDEDEVEADDDEQMNERMDGGMGRNTRRAEHFR